MNAQVYFLNHKRFTSKDKTKVYRVLTVCDGQGNVSEYFYRNEGHDYDSFTLFQPINLSLSVSNYKGKTHLDLLDAFPISYDD